MAVKIMKKPKLSFWQKIYIGAIFQGLFITLRHALRNLLNQDAIKTYDCP